MRCLEHIPVLGHGIAAMHACRGERNQAERAALNATVGIVLAPVNIVAEVVDEATRDHPLRLKQVRARDNLHLPSPPPPETQLKLGLDLATQDLVWLDGVEFNAPLDTV